MINNSGMTQGEIADKVDIRPNTISDFLNGKTGMRVDNIDSILNAIIRSKN